MSKHMTIINLACTITKLRKWGEAWKHSAESAQAATARMHQAHEAKMVEHRAAFGARTEAYAKIIAGLRSEIGAARMAVLERDSLMSERDGLLTQVQDMRAEIERLQWENKTMHKDAEDGYAAAIKVLGDPVALSKERDALRAEVDFLKIRDREYEKALDLCEKEEQTPAECIGSLNARIDRLQDEARSDARVREDLHRINVELRAEINFLKTLRPKYKVGDKLESYSSAVTIVGVRTVYDCQTDGAEYPVGHSEDELKERYEQTPKQHPVKVGEWVRRTKLPGDQSPVGIIKQVTLIRCDGDSYGFADGDFWSVDNCEPCAHQHPAQDGQWVRRTVASGTEPVGTMIQVLRSRTLHSEYVTQGAQVVPWAHCEPCDPPNHDTKAGKAAAEAVIRDSQSRDINDGDLVEVVSNTGRNTWLADVGSVGTVTSIETINDSISVYLDDVPGKKNVLAGYVSLCDVRKVST